MAGYAADAYARLRGTGAVCLTYGVGTFGVLNALAGSYVEELPVALVVGSPSFANRQVERREGVLYHHSTGKLTADAQSVKNVVVAREVVRSGWRAPAQIDRALNAALTWRRPVYIEVYQNAWRESCRPPAGALVPGALPLSKR
ncbi:MAG: thiamine pyrophosphate-binding protein, partial [Thermoanaerobaculia bacterium]